jgi:hypothetical protein
MAFDEVERAMEVVDSVAFSGLAGSVVREGDFS